ncbi:hypothetical protein [Paenibacillus sp. UNC496MF]|uniref:hypothetical protein n=1 Tax=Paenibacillus sp. UNC496MF TaxID=1502753 RepID=UPI000B86B84E|nr:hypothetical protein [Paenibacillus sp. UNC496MF]
MADWYLEDIHGVRHKAVIAAMQPNQAAKARWTKGLSWHRELKATDRETFVLIDDATGTAQGAISLSDAGDHVYIHLLENAPHNRSVANPRQFVNVSRILIGFAGAISNSFGYEGFLALTPKSSLEDYYARLFKAFPLPDRKMGIHGVVSNHWYRVYYT